jgi:hypothetical protein
VTSRLGTGNSRTFFLRCMVHKYSSTQVLHQFSFLHGSISLPLYPICYTNPNLSMVQSALFYQSIASVPFSLWFHQPSSTKVLHQLCSLHDSISFLLPSVASVMSSLRFHQFSSSKVLHQLCSLYGSISFLLPSVASVMFSLRFHQFSSSKCCISSVFSMVPSALFYPSVASVLFSPRPHQFSPRGIFTLEIFPGKVV